jgi:hypothetical protein
MELLLSAITLGSLYAIKQQSKKENYQNIQLPNTNIPDANYLPADNVKEHNTSKIITTQAFQGKAYSDKYFETPEYKKNETYMSSTGEKVTKDHFHHKNMQPAFGSRLRDNHLSNYSNEGLMDSHVGLGSQMIERREVTPLFAPQKDVQWAHGMPNYTDFELSRVNPSMKMSNVKPFESIRVAPGLGMKGGTENVGGYNSGLISRELWADKTVDELRVKTKPKASEFSLIGLEGHSHHFIKNRAEDGGKVEKNRPERVFERGPETFFTTTGIESRQPLDATPVIRYTNRPETSAGYHGAANSIHPAEYVVGEYRPSTNQELGPAPFMPVSRAGRGGASDADYNLRSTEVLNNNRSASAQSAYFGTVGSRILQETIEPFVNVLRPTRKENMVGNMRPFQNAKTTVSNSYIYDDRDIPATTIKESTIQSVNHLQVNAQSRGAYQVTPVQNHPNVRDDTNVFYSGVSSANAFSRKQGSYESEFNQRLHNQMKPDVVAGYMPSGNMKLFNADIHMTSRAADRNHLSQRAVVPQMPKLLAGVDGFGAFQQRSLPEVSYRQLDRNNGDILDQLKNNPYTHPLIYNKPIGV